MGCIAAWFGSGSAICSWGDDVYVVGLRHWLRAWVAAGCPDPERTD